jgi:hypothetical protein
MAAVDPLNLRFKHPSGALRGPSDSKDPPPVRSTRQMLLDVIDRVLHAADLLGVLVRDVDFE